jgi:phosphoribosylformylglycinamidine synthase
MCKSCGIDGIERIERSRRYLFKSTISFDTSTLQSLYSLLYDRMTETIYDTPLTTFSHNSNDNINDNSNDSIIDTSANTNNNNTQTFKMIPLLTEGKSALIKINQELGLGFDAWDIEFYYNMFVTTLQRNPTEVECFDLGELISCYCMLKHS